MSKYNSDFKLEVAKYVIDKNHSYGEAARKFSIDKNSVKKWSRKYEEHGVKAIVKNKIKYDGNFKLNVVNYMHSNHLSLNQTTIHFNLGHHSVISKWERIYYEEGPQALFKERRGRSKNMSSKPIKKSLSEKTEKDLIYEVQQLRMENAYLKKLQALVQERVKRENPKKHKPSQN